MVKPHRKNTPIFQSNDEFSLLRPETVESLFVLWRITHREKYRAWAWDLFSAIERSARNAKGHYRYDPLILTFR